MCPQPNSGSPTAGAELACQRPSTISPTVRSPALVLTLVLEVLRVGALDLEVALGAIDRGVVLDAGDRLAGALGALEAAQGGVAGSSGAAIPQATVVVHGDDLLGLGTGRS